MAQYTDNYNLKKPEGTEYYNVSDQNGNMDIIDGAMAGLQTNKVDKVANKGLSTNDYTTAEKNKLAGIEVNANKYVLPLAASGTRGGVQVGYTQSGKNYPVQLSSEKMYVNVPWTDTTYDDATTSTHGLMSTTDKSKLNGIANNANNYSLPLAANGTRGGVQVGYTSSGKNYAVQLSGEKMYVNVPWIDSDATTSAHGLMSAADKTKLNGIAAGAQVNPGNATTSAAGLMSAADKTKLNGIATGANNYTLPLAASGTRGGVQLGYSTSGKNYAVQQSGEKLYVNVPWIDSDATTSAHGLMSAADKTKLNGLPALKTSRTTANISYGVWELPSGLYGKRIWSVTVEEGNAFFAGSSVNSSGMDTALYFLKWNSGSISAYSGTRYVRIIYSDS